jgi:four helix bundle protein
MGQKGLSSFQQLKVWKKAHRLVLRVYELTGKYPKDERYGLVSQMRRAAVSVPANIAEGFKRRSPREKTRFYNIAEGSLEELKYFFILSRDLGYLNTNQDELSQADEIGRMLNGLITSTERRI